MENRYRHNRISLRFSDDEFFILKEKMRLSGEKSMNSFFRKLLLKGYVYQIDMSEYMTFNTHLSRIDSSLNQISELIHYKKQYDSFKQIHSRYLSSKDPERYLRRHEADLMLFDAANRKLKEMGVNPDRLSLSKMEQDLFAMKDRKNTLTDKAKKLKTKEKELSKHYDNLKGYLKEGLVADSTYKSKVKPATPQL